MIAREWNLTARPLRQIPDLSAIWPRFAEDALYVPSESGALFRNDGNSFTVTAPGTYELMCVLEADLTGKCSLEEICKRHPPAIRARIVWLAQQLLARGIVRNDFGRRGKSICDALRRRFSSQIAFLEHLADGPEERFEAFRKSHVLLVGSGISFWYCAAALIRNGLEALCLVDMDGSGKGIREVDREVEALRKDGISASVYLASRQQEFVTARADRLSLILYVADSISIRSLASVGRRALSESCPVIPGFMVENQILLGPLARAPACLVCTFMRIARELWGRKHAQMLSDRIAANGGRLQPLAPEAAPLARRLGGDAAFEAFKTLAGSLRPDIERGLLVQTAVEHDYVRAIHMPCTSHWCWNVCAPQDRSPARTRPLRQPIR